MPKQLFAYVAGLCIAGVILGVGTLMFVPISCESGLRGDALTKNQLKLICLSYGDFAMTQRKSASEGFGHAGT